MNLQGELGSISYLYGRHHGGADFDYTDEPHQTIFAYEDQSFVGNHNKFRVLDYSTGSTILQIFNADKYILYQATAVLTKGIKPLPSFFVYITRRWVHIKSIKPNTYGNK